MLIILLATPTFAAKISLPLDGFYHPGAYMPVAVYSASPATIEAGPGVATHTPAMSGVTPVFVLQASASRVRCGEDSLPLRALAEDQKLIGMTRRDEPMAQALCPSARVVIVDLDPINPLPGPTLAWDALDVVVVDSINPKIIPQLLAMNTAIAVRSSDMPTGSWPWKRVGDAWVMQADASDHSPLQGEAAYQAIPWTAGRSGAARQMIFIIAVFCSCGLLGISLWRSRYSVLLLGAFSLAFCTGFFWWQGRRSEVLSISQVLRGRDDLGRVDRLTYQTSPTPTPAELTFANGEEATWPIFASPAQAVSLGVVLDCDATGTPKKFHYELPANGRMIFLSRGVRAE